MKSEAGEIRFPGVRLRYKATVIKQLCFVLARNRNVQQWNKIGSPEINPCTYGHLICDKARIQSGEKTASSVSGTGKTGQLRVKE